jgi:hypothetical protein
MPDDRADPATEFLDRLTRIVNYPRLQSGA